MPHTPIPTFIKAIPVWGLIAVASVGCGGTGGQEGGGQTGPDTTPPAVVSRFPTENQSNVNRDTLLSVTFSEALDPATVTIDSVRLTQDGAGRVQANDPTWDSGTNTLQLKPTTQLGDRTQYTAELTDGIADVAGNRLQGLSWKFTTGSEIDAQAPVWRCSVVFTATATRFDAVDVSWAGQNLNLCSPGAVIPSTPATDNITPSDQLRFFVEYQRTDGSDSQFTPAPATAASTLKVTGLRAETEYIFRVKVRDLAGQESTLGPTATATTKPAGRLYVANFQGHLDPTNGKGESTISSLPGIGQASGNHDAAVIFADETGLAGQTGLTGPTSLWVDIDPGTDRTKDLVYVANAGDNSISAYQLWEDADGNPATPLSRLGDYGVRNNAKPVWTIRGDRSTGDITELSAPTSLWLETGSTAGQPFKRLYVANTFRTTRSNGAAVGNNIAIFNVLNPPSGPNSAPEGVIRSENFFRTPIAFAVDSTNHLLYVANRDHAASGDQAGATILVFDNFTSSPREMANNAFGNTPSRIFWGEQPGPCVSTDTSTSLCGPSGIALDATNNTLYVVNRGRHNLLMFPNPSTATGSQGASVKKVEGADTGLAAARPNSLFLDTTTDRLYVTTDRGQSLLIFNKTDLTNGGNVLPVRVIKGSKTVFGQSRLNPAQQANGPSGVMVIGNEAYVATLGAFGGFATAIPSLGVFSVIPGVSPSGDDPPVTATTLTARTTNTPPKRLVVNPMLGLSGAALDRENDRLYLAGFHSNMILVYENAGDFQDGLRLPNRIIAGPQTGLENPVGLAFRPETAMYREALYVVNQSGHSVVVFGGEPQSLAAPELDTLSGDVPFRRYLGAGEGIDPFITPTTTELVSPTGIAIDETNNILYVSNRDAKTWEDFVGRKILAFASADTVEGNMAPTWAIEGHEPVLPTFLNPNPVQTDKTTFKRPSALLLEPDPTPNDLVPQDRLYVANRDGQSVLVFEGVAQKVLATTTLDRNQGPAWRIRHAALTNPAGLALNADVRELYASDLLTDAILAFDVSNLPAANPNPVLTPRVVQGLQTGLKLPLGLALDPLK